VVQDILKRKIPLVLVTLLVGLGVYNPFGDPTSGQDPSNDASTQIRQAQLQRQLETQRSRVTGPGPDTEYRIALNDCVNSERSSCSSDCYDGRKSELTSDPRVGMRILDSCNRSCEPEARQTCAAKLKSTRVD